MQTDAFPFISCTNLDNEGNKYPLYGVYDGNHRVLAAILSVLQYESKTIHGRTLIRVRLMKPDTDMRILEGFSMVHTHTRAYTYMCLYVYINR